MNRQPFTRTVLPVLAIFAMGLSAYLIIAGQPNRSNEALTVTAVASSEPSKIVAAGIIEPGDGFIRVGTRKSGVVSGLYVAEGVTVDKGQPLFSVDDTEAVTRVNEARANLDFAQQSAAAARGAFSTANTRSALYEGIDDPRAVSLRELNDIRGTAREALGQLRIAEADVRRAKTALDSAIGSARQHTVKAPQSGTVLEVNIKEGEFVQVGDFPGGVHTAPIVMGRDGPLHARVEVDENDIGLIDRGAAALIRTRASKLPGILADFVRAKPTIIAQQPSSPRFGERVGDRVLQVFYVLPDNDDRFTVGQQVEAVIPQAGDQK